MHCPSSLATLTVVPTPSSTASSLTISAAPSSMFYACAAACWVQLAGQKKNPWTTMCHGSQEQRCGKMHMPTAPLPAEDSATRSQLQSRTPHWDHQLLKSPFTTPSLAPHYSPADCLSGSPRTHSHLLPSHRLCASPRDSKGSVLTPLRRMLAFRRMPPQG